MVSLIDDELMVPRRKPHEAEKVPKVRLLLEVGPQTHSMRRIFNIITMPQLPVVSQLLGFLVHHQNLLKTLPLPAPSPKNIPTPSWMATLTGRIGAESYTWGQGCGRGLGARWGFAAECGLDESKVRSFSYMEGKRGDEARSVYFGSS